LSAAKDSAWGHALAAALVATAPLVAFLKTNRYPLDSAESIVLLAAFAGGGALLGLAASRMPLAAPLLLGAGAALFLDLMYGAHLRLSGTGLAATLLLCLALAVALRRHVALVVVAASSVFLATTLLIPGSSAQPRRPAPGAERAAAPAAGAPPVLLHLVLDEHIGIDGLPAELPQGTELGRWLTGAYVRRGFRVYAGAYSQYFDTRNSIANLLNFTSHDGNWTHLADGRRNPYVLTASAYFRHLGALGYRLRVYQSDYLDYCQVPGVTYTACTAYASNSIGALASTALPPLERARFIFNSFTASSRYLGRARAAYGNFRAAHPGLPLPAWADAVSRVGPLAVLPVLKQLEADLRSASRGNAYFAHLLLPHYPYVLDESCRVRRRIGQWLYNVAASTPGRQGMMNTAASRAARYRSYFAQIRCQQTLLERLFDAMEEAKVWHDAVVIVHGDHGSRIVRRIPVTRNAGRLTAADLNDAFSTLFAARLPGRDGAVVRGARPLQEILGETLGLPFAPAPRQVYLRREDDDRLIPLALPGP
jgi:hypothetical protein